MGSFTKGNVFNIQKFSVDDGPGIRTTVFLKGCTLHCIWCHNPESISPGSQLQFYPNKCIKCFKCCEACPSGALLRKDNDIVYIKEKCLLCRKCTEACSSKSITAAGKEMTVKEVLAEVKKDMPFYKNSGGGVTFSGGEPLMQHEFLKELLIESKKMGLHTTVDTAGNVPWNAFEDIMEYVDLFLFDIKLKNNEKHKSAVGSGNGQILSNLQKLDSSGAQIIIRVPVIPGINDNICEMEEIAGFVKRLRSVELIELLPYHSLGESKYESLSIEYSLKGCRPPSKDLMDRLSKVYCDKGLPTSTR